MKTAYIHYSQQKMSIFLPKMSLNHTALQPTLGPALNN